MPATVSAMAESAPTRAISRGQRASVFAECFEECRNVCEASPVTSCNGNERLFRGADLRHISPCNFKWRDVIVAALNHKERNGEVEPQVSRIQGIFDGRKL